MTKAISSEGTRFPALAESILRNAFGKRWEALSYANKNEDKRGGNDMAKRLNLTQWGNVFHNLSELTDSEYGNEVEVMYMDNVPSPGEWALCHGETLFEDGFATEHDAEQRLEHITKVIDLKPVASICISNTTAIVIYECEGDRVIAGLNDDVPEICEVEYELPEDADEDDEDIESEPVFYLHDTRLSLSDAMRLNY